MWSGKYNGDDTLKELPRVCLPFQVIETVNESRASREVQKQKVLGFSRSMSALRATLSMLAGTTHSFRVTTFSSWDRCSI